MFFASHTLKNIHYALSWIQPDLHDNDDDSHSNESQHFETLFDREFIDTILAISKIVDNEEFQSGELSATDSAHQTLHMITFACEISIFTFQQAIACSTFWSKERFIVLDTVKYSRFLFEKL